MESCGLGQVLMAGSCEHASEPMDSEHFRKFSSNIATIGFSRKLGYLKLVSVIRPSFNSQDMESAAC
jgi:hypothetical protein